MPVMKKKKKKNLIPAVIIALTVLVVAAIVYIIGFHREDTVAVRPLPEIGNPAEEPRAAVKEKPKAKAPVKETVEKKKDVAFSPKPAAKPTQKEKIIVAGIVPPRQPAKEVAIIIDDIGYDMKPVRELLKIDADITFAVLPLIAHSREAARVLHQADREILLHLPMEPLSYPKEKPGSGALFTEMNEEEIAFQLEKNLASVPYAAGVNNHMGSKFMADEDKLESVFKKLKSREMFFIDSRTTPSSKTAGAAKKAHLTVASRKIFLDHERDYDKIYRVLMDVAELPAGNPPVIVIGHPYPETIQAIRDARNVFRKKGVSIVPVSQLIKAKTSEGSS